MPFSGEVKHGIRLHRAVDSFTDQHAWVKRLKTELGPLRRYGGIIIDVLLDYHLASNFEQYHELSLSQFAQKVYPQIEINRELYPERFVRVCTAMCEMDWLSGYNNLANIERAFNGISARLSRPVDLAKSLDWHQSNAHLFQQDFEAFYLELISFARQYARQV